MLLPLTLRLLLSQQGLTATSQSGAVCKLTIPLMCTVDYHGYRVLAVAKLPLAKQVFTAEGKLRKTTTELVHGTVDRGATVAAEDRGIMAALQVCHAVHS
jgi:uncharacterized membrane-anchored protein